MRKLILILGNGFSMDLLSHLNKDNSNIDLANLFSKGDTVLWPDGSHERGFLSYKHCPSLWNLGARPHIDQQTANNLIEDIITCANMMSSSNISKSYNNIYLDAYYELASYLKYLFIQYDTQIEKADLQLITTSNWGWLKLLKSANQNENFEKIIIITYNYDIFLERILLLNEIPFNVGGFNDPEQKVTLLKPHGSISFTHKKFLEPATFSIRKNTDMYEAQLSDFTVKYENLDLNYLINALIPPAGDSSRLTHKWAQELRDIIKTYMNSISNGDKCIISGISYWPVDRPEIDMILAALSQNNIDTYMVNPHPPRALNAVLTCMLPNHISYSSSDWIGDIANG